MISDIYILSFYYKKLVPINDMSEIVNQVDPKDVKLLGLTTEIQDPKSQLKSSDGDETGGSSRRKQVQCNHQLEA